MKSFNYNKRVLYMSSLMVALVGLTSFNPFSQETHMAQLNDKDESTEFASLSGFTSTMNAIVASIAPVFSLPDKQAGGNNTNSVNGRTVVRGGSTNGSSTGGTISRNWQGSESTASDLSASYGSVTGSTTNDRRLNIGASGFVTRTNEKISLTVLRWENDGNNDFRIYFKAKETPELKKLQTEASLCTADFCIATTNALTEEQSVLVENLNIADFLSGTGDARSKVEGAILSQYRDITKGIKKPVLTAEGKELEDCTEGEYKDRYQCLRTMKKQVCTARQLRKDDEKCLDKEEYSAMLQEFIEEVTLDPEVSNREFSKFARLASKDRDASQMIRIASQYRSFMGSNEHFEKNIDRTMNQVGRLDDQIASLEQYAFSNPWAMYQQQMLSVQRQGLVAQIEKDVEQYKNYYQRSALGSSRNTRGEYADFSQNLRSDLELTYSEIVSPISEMFFDPSLAYLDKSSYNGVNTLANNNSGRPPQFGNTALNIDTGSNNSCASYDTNCQNGYMQNASDRRNMFTSNDNNSSNQYNQNDPYMSNRQPPPISPNWRNQNQQQFAQQNNNNGNQAPVNFGRWN